MSFKADTLLKKATTFERLALYGDRRSFLQALAQESPVTDPAPWRIYDEPNDPRGNEKNWVPNIQPGGTRQYVYMGPNVPAGGVQHTPSLWDKYFRPQESNVLPRTIMPPTNDAAPVDRDQSILMSKELNAPAVQEKGAPAPAAYTPDSNTVNMLQRFLNTAFRPEIESGQLGPIAQDGQLGRDTLSRLQQWARQNHVNVGNLQKLVNAALGRK